MTDNTNGQDTTNIVHLPPKPQPKPRENEIMIFISGIMLTSGNECFWMPLCPADMRALAELLMCEANSEQDIRPPAPPVRIIHRTDCPF